MFNVLIMEKIRDTNIIHTQCYRRNAIAHRMYGPAFRQWLDNSSLYIENWWMDGCIHNPYGPAANEWDKDGTLIEAEYYLYNIKISDTIRQWASVMGISDIMNMSPDELVMFKIAWGK